MTMSKSSLGNVASAIEAVLAHNKSVAQLQRPMEKAPIMGTQRKEGKMVYQ